MQPGFFYELAGSFAALGSAAAWALSSILFRRAGDKIPALSMNFAKCLIGIFLLGAMLLITGIEQVSGRAFFILGISGLLGITFGDTLFFKALICLGPRLALLVGATAGPVVTVILAMILLGERLSMPGMFGVFFTLLGVGFVLGEQFSLEKSLEKTEKKLIPGIKYISLSILCTAFGIILAKVGVASVSPLQATFFRFLWAFIGLALWGSINGRIKKWLLPFKNDFPLLKLIFSAVCVAIFGGFWLFIISLKYIDASVATILNSTTPLFIVPMAAIMLKEKITLPAVGGTVVAVAGLILVFAT
ncbi:MAG: EamA family transporter [Candidatus Omnitrophica bacterium CG11_big_fil_rev_8_21_14_0_20_42_13]|uniref:EamA family transporter n=1 Tax=Candidatus Ghiorseimicrobium undicola TaxID=1974746 RepID=A0A2H0LVQ3_9BACT|nr:MAG: EamA family transporter [Candidatus Omnitrophica bacterium CG11_big_fil_rev_8_21_14_0_20_42_13]